MVTEVPIRVGTPLSLEPETAEIRWHDRPPFTWVKRHPFRVILASATIILTGEYLSIPSSSEIARLNTTNPETTALIEQRRRERGDGWRLVRQWVPISRISPHLIHAVVAAEDGQFFSHEGIDWFEVKESIERNLHEGKVVRGASTITQQLAKNLYFSTSKNPVRKIKELITAKRLENELTKRRILELYLNIIELGDGIFGVEAASKQYFGVSAGQLDRGASAKLAAVIASPLRHRPTDQSRYTMSRTRVILQRMEARNW
jgi:monofunctional biosynthetic peptidoglycan transglycosylase